MTTLPPSRAQLGRSPVVVSRLGVGTMAWTARSRRTDLARWAYGPPEDLASREGAVETSLAGGVDLFDTAAMYGAGASERCLGALLSGKEAPVATKFPGSLWRSGASALPSVLGESLERLGRRAVDLYQLHAPLPSRRASFRFRERGTPSRHDTTPGRWPSRSSRRRW